MKPASRNSGSAPIVITAALDLRRSPSVSTSVSSSSRRSSTSEGSEFKKPDLVPNGDLTDNPKPLDRVYPQATMSRTSINMLQNDLPAVTESSLPEASNLREFTSPTPSGDSSPPPIQYMSPFTTLTRPGDEDLFVKVSALPETAGQRDQQSQFVLPTPPLTRAGTKSTRKSTPPRPGSGPREGRNVEGREEVDVTDTRQRQDSRVDDLNPSLDPEGSLEGGKIVGPSRRTTTTHPLKLDIPPNSHSPHIWEIVGPPDDNNVPYCANDEIFAAQSSKRLIPKSSYYYGPPPSDTAFGTDPIGQIGVHHPREIVRIERDYSGGEITQFSAVYPLELEGRITPTQFLESINAINETLISAHSLSHSCLDNMLAFFTLQLSRFVTTTHYEKEMGRLHQLIEVMNRTTFNPVGLNIVWPRNVGFIFLEIEYY